MKKCPKEWLNILNETYNTQAQSLQELQLGGLVRSILDTTVHFRDRGGTSWARYLPQNRSLIGKNDHVITQVPQNPALWWGEELSHQNQKDPDMAKGDWTCEHGILDNRLGSRLVVHGLVPKCILVPFLEWQPGLSRYNHLAYDYERMMEMFRFDFGIEDDSISLPSRQAISSKIVKD